LNQETKGGEKMKKNRYLLIISLATLLLFLITAVAMAQMRTHAGDKEISFSGYFTSSNETNWNIGVNGGYFLTDTFQVGLEFYITGTEGVDNNTDTFGIADVYVLYHFPTPKSSFWEPFVGLQAGATMGDEGQSVAGVKVGVNIYFTDNAGFAIGYEPLYLFDDEDIEHNIAMEIFFQFH